MARRSYNKLVRDKVPTAIVQGGDEAITSVLEDKEEILFALDEKLDEEVCDYQVTKEMAELADVLEVSTRSRRPTASRSRSWTRSVCTSVRRAAVLRR